MLGPTARKAANKEVPHTDEVYSTLSAEAPEEEQLERVQELLQELQHALAARLSREVSGRHLLAQ